MFGLRQPAEGLETEVDIKGEPQVRRARGVQSDRGGGWRDTARHHTAPAHCDRHLSVVLAGQSLLLCCSGPPACLPALLPALLQPPSDGPASKSLVKQSLDEIGVLAGNLLMNAASWRVVRGQTYCLHCRGTGKESCPTCQVGGPHKRASMPLSPPFGGGQSVAGPLAAALGSHRQQHQLLPRAPKPRCLCLCRALASCSPRRFG